MAYHCRKKCRRRDQRDGRRRQVAWSDLFVVLVGVTGTLAPRQGRSPW